MTRYVPVSDVIKIIDAMISTIRICIDGCILVSQQEHKQGLLHSIETLELLKKHIMKEND